MAYQALGGKKNIRQGLQYQEQSLKMRQNLFPGNHRDIAVSLYNIGLAYEKLGGDENILKGINYQEDALKMQKELFPNSQHPDVAISLNNMGIAYTELGGEENIRKGLEYIKQSLESREALSPGNHPEIADLLHDIGATYGDLNGEANNCIRYLNRSIEMRRGLLNQELLKNNRYVSDIKDLSKVADSLNKMGIAYTELGGEANIREGLKYQM